MAALNAATKPGAYAAIDSGATWGSGATAVGLVYRTDRVHPVGSPAILTTGAFSQVGSEPPHAPPMAQTFEEATWGERLTVIVNQWRGRGGCPADGADADQGDGQGCWNAARAAAATELADWAASDPTGSADPDRLILGELNAFRLETPLQNLRAAGFVDLVEQFSGEQAVSYLWAGAGGYADCALASASLAGQARAAAIWSINADEPSALDYQTENKSAGQLETLYAADAFRSSDRNPVVVDLALMPDQSDLGGEYGLAWHTGQGEWRLGSAWGGADDGALRGAGSWNDGQGEVSVSVGGPAGEYGCLYAWLDYSNGDAQPGAVDSPNGRWDANEEVVRGLPLPPAKDQGVTFALPVGVIDAMGAYNMRFRLIPAPEPSRADCGAAEVTEPGPTGRADGGEVEDWTFSSGPLAVTIGAFAARLYGDTTTVTWETVDEIDLVGFDVFAATGQEGPWERVNGGLIPARAPGSTEGASYTLSYRSGAQVRWHRLEALETSGARYAFGPLAADETRPTVVRLRAGSAQRVSNGWATAAYLGCIAAAICLWICLRRKMR